jgi:uncharacterized SAM-binding protein YcdF (DUF218 family)
METEILIDAKVLWDYHRLNMDAGSADVILGLGSYDASVAEFAAKLFLQGSAPCLMFSGGVVPRSDLLKTPWSEPEAVVFRRIAVQQGVPAERILIETDSKNTGENIRYSLALLRSAMVPCRSLIVVTKPNMERRARSTAAIEARDIDVAVTSPPCSFEDYVTRFDPAFLINLMVGDLQRIEHYPQLGFQAVEPIPEFVRGAFARLVAAGFTRHLLAVPGDAR